jgi:hypothetical protein
MTVDEVKSRAKALGLEPDRFEVKELIHLIQVKEGTSPCFGLHGQWCTEERCCWWDRCHIPWPVHQFEVTGSSSVGRAE